MQAPFEEITFERSRRGDRAGVLGRGGFSAVYRAAFRGAPAAVKCFARPPRGHPDARKWPAMVAAFDAEAELLWAVRDAHVVRVSGVAKDVEAGEVVELALVTTLAWGTLDEFVAARGSAASGAGGADGADGVEGAEVPGPPTRAAVLRALVGAAHGLAFLHERAIVHADIKPANVLVSASGEGMLAEFGLSRLRLVSDDAPGASFFGHRDTPVFMAPELHHSKPLSTACDVYSLALTAWDALVPGELFEHERASAPPHSDASAAIFKHVDAGGRPDAARVGDAGLAAALERAWATDPADRPPVTDLLAALEAAAATEAAENGGGGGGGPAAPVAAPDAAMEAVLRGHTATVLSACVTARGGLLVSASRDMTLRVWDMSGAALATPGGAASPRSPAPRGLLGALAQPGGAISPALARSMSDSTAAAAARAAPAALRVLGGHTNGVYGVCALPGGSGTRVVSASQDKTLRVWDAATGACELVLRGHMTGVWGVCATGEGRIVSASTDESLRVWDAATGECERLLEGHTGGVGSVAALPGDGDRVVSASWDSTLRVWNAASGACERVLKGHGGGVYGVCTIPGRIVSASYDQTLRVWDSATGACERVLKGHADGIDAVCVVTSALVASGSRDRTVRVWDLETGACRRIFEGHGGGVFGVCALPGGRVASASEDGALRVWRM